MKSNTINIARLESVSSNSTQVYNFEQYYDTIKLGYDPSAVEIARGVKHDNPEKYKQLKQARPVVMPNATFGASTKLKDLKTLSGIMYMDFDLNINGDKYQQLKNDKYTYCIHKSFGGDGVSLFVKVAKSGDFKDKWRSLNEYYVENYGVFADAQCKNINRKLFISYDPEIYLNESSDIWRKTTVKKEKIKKQDINYVFTESDFDNILQQIKDNQVDLTQNRYERYLCIGFALADAFGESGRDKYHLICSMASKYDSKNCDKQYDNCLKSKGDGVTMATVYYYAKHEGIKIYSEKTNEAIKTRNRWKAQGVKEDKKKLIEHVKTVTGENLPEEDAHRILEYEGSLSTQGEDSDNNSVQLRKYLTETFTPEYDSIKNRVYVHDRTQPLEDRNLNTLIQNCKEHFDFKVASQDVRTILNSNYVTEFNPLRDWFENNYDATQNYNGSIKDYIGLVDMPKTNVSKEEYTMLFTKWLVGCLHNVFNEDANEISETVFILKGGQGAGKTVFFKYLVPAELKKDYFATEEVVASDKDSMFRLATHFILLFDEVGKTVKKDFEEFKRICSIDSITQRRPFASADETFKRVASICGTTNEDELLYDPTGNRRIIIMPVNIVDFKKLQKMDSTNLWLEAYHLYLNDYDWNTNTPDTREIIDRINVSYQEEIMEEAYVDKYVVFFDDKLKNPEVPAGRSYKGVGVYNLGEVGEHIHTSINGKIRLPDIKKAIKSKAQKMNCARKPRSVNTGLKNGYFCALMHE